MRPKSETDRVSIALPDHPRARKNGWVYVHILVAEKLLNRPLKPGEVVHHIDGDSSNNDESNLMVFRSNGEHTRFHAGYEAVLQSDGAYTSAGRQCKSCGRSITYPTKALCLDCYRADLAARIPSAEELKALVWAMPSTEVAKKLGVSDTAVKKWCRKYGIEKPGRGYWSGKP